ncbi:virulence factor [Photorhabdus laumondii subsp. laumondii]|uniref:Photorhabdus luminescens subsp. laumondii TTO1 complete genome segment 13/17 n=2 Tax=Photorhabdus laumondii subsp. laumondii TaxID=141679 RepID=Q7N0X1_PHOLL|nr:MULTISPECIES: virulence-associated V antigen [Photorhabdus]AWK43377.1 virulence factor [Photorhabdus laumondii subsp. laumondii]AXG44050.1 virulence factor [Photorhabdus laumondii subsp. laumondii]AXG48683.1 virulence factor [Photorhabdus laumondii subsp. laumondii]KTL63080.1 virulence factor [Photorhabdus laumondii subsp. laumondii]MCC8383225.1 virulence-associated V antigen [Photorhabdus laumondii]
MEIRPYQNDPQLFLADLEKVSLAQLQGSGSSELDRLVNLIFDKGIKITSDSSVVTENKELLKKLIAYFLPADAVVEGGHLDSQIKNGINNLESFLNSSTLKTWTLKDFLAAVHFNLTPDRLDDDVIDIFVSVMSGHDKKRLELRDELATLTAELKIYSVIQSEINAKLAANGELKIDDNSFNLLDHKKYGFSDQPTFEKSAEYKLLRKISSGSEISIKTFLESSNKQSGAMAGLENSYEYDKENNRLANFSTSVNDRVSPLNNTVQEKTTRLNEASSRYNAAIEALNRFIQKYDSIIRNILGAI